MYKQEIELGRQWIKQKKIRKNKITAVMNRRNQKLNHRTTDKSNVKLCQRIPLSTKSNVCFMYLFTNINSNRYYHGQ